MPKGRGRPKSTVSKTTITVRITDEARYKLASLRLRLLKDGVSVGPGDIIATLISRADEDSVAEATRRLKRRR